MRILYAGDTGSPHFRAWPLHFLDLGHDVHICHVSPSPPEPFPGPTWQQPATRVASSRRGVWRLGALQLRRVARTVRPDIVHTHLVVPGGYLAATARLAPHVATAWGSEVLLAETVRQRKMIARVSGTADLLTADSHHLLDLLEDYGAARSRLRFVPWGVDLRWVERGRKVTPGEAVAQLGLPAGKRYVLFHRGTRPIYRPEVFLQALARARVELPDVVGLVLTDMTTSALPVDQLRELALTLQLEDGVIFRNKVSHDEMAIVYRAAAACVSIPESDSAPTSVFEALALWVPAVVSRLPWIDEPVYRDARLRVVEGADAEAVARAVVRAVTHDDTATLEYNARLVERDLDRRRSFGHIEADYRRLAQTAYR